MAMEDRLMLTGMVQEDRWLAGVEDTVVVDSLLN